MSEKNKQTSLDKFSSIAQQTGMVIMAAAMTLSLAELRENPANRLVLPNQPALEMVGTHSEPTGHEKEEVRPHHVSYSAYQRTAARSGEA